MAIQLLKKTELYSPTGRANAKRIALIEPCDAYFDRFLLVLRGVCHEPSESPIRVIFGNHGSFPNLPRTCHPMVLQSTKQEKGTHS